MHQQLPPEQLDRLICLEARIHKKSKEEIIQEQFLQMECERQTDENDRNKLNVDSNKKSDDLKCSLNSENSPQNLFPSQNMSPVQKKCIITKKHSQQKKKKKIKEGQQKDITQYLQFQKKQQKVKKSEQKLIEYSIQDSPFKNKSPLPYDPTVEKQLKEKQNQLAISEIKIKELETHNSELRDTISVCIIELNINQIKHNIYGPKYQTQSLDQFYIFIDEQKVQDIQIISIVFEQNQLDSFSQVIIK